MKKISELVSHIKKHNDAVIIIGGGINPDKPTYDIETFNREYNRKNLKRNPTALWSFYANNINSNINDCESYKLIEKINNSMILDQNTNGSIPASYLHGHVDLFKCQKCKVVFPIEGLVLDPSNNITPGECECCGGQLRPTVLLSEERYDQLLFDDFKDKLLNTHTLILIGMDYTEAPLLNLIADYGDMKSQLNAEGNPDNERAIVAIQSEDEEFDPNYLAFCEFLVKGDIEKSIKKLVEAF